MNATPHENPFEKEEAEVQGIIMDISIMMNWENEKAALWLCVRNPLFGEAMPISFIYAGRGHKVMRFIETAREENKLI